MQMVLAGAQSIVLMVASMVMGICLCWSLWLILRLISHPEWGPPLVAIPIFFAIVGVLPDSEFLRRALVFAAASAGPFWIAGMIWRANWQKRAAPLEDAEGHTQTQAAGPDVPTAASSQCRVYPALTGCIAEARDPTADELKKVAVRIWREAFAGRYPSPSFSERRILLRVAVASLRGNSDRR